MRQVVMANPGFAGLHQTSWTTISTCSELIIVVQAHNLPPLRLMLPDILADCGVFVLPEAFCDVTVDRHHDLLGDVLR